MSTQKNIKKSKNVCPHLTHVTLTLDGVGKIGQGESPDLWMRIAANG